MASRGIIQALGGEHGWRCSDRAKGHLAANDGNSNTIEAVCGGTCCKVFAQDELECPTLTMLSVTNLTAAFSAFVPA